MIYKAEDLKDWDMMHSDDGEHWYPARPENYRFESIPSRLKSTWLVLIGKCDALSWTPRKPK